MGKKKADSVTIHNQSKPNLGDTALILAGMTRALMEEVEPVLAGIKAGDDRSERHLSDLRAKVSDLRTRLDRLWEATYE